MYKEDWECFYCQMSNNWQKLECYWCKKPKRQEEETRIPLYAPSPFSDREYSMMPAVWQEKGFRFLFTFHDRGEPPHIHAQRKGSSRDNMKVWLESLEVEYCKGFNTSERTDILRIVEKKQDFFLRKWKEFFGES